MSSLSLQASADMQVFAHRYLIHFSDTMAYGSHHFLTNFKFQCAAREALLFLAEPDGTEPWRSELGSVELLTREGYTRNLSPLGLGDWAAVLLTAEEVSYGSFRLCFRVVSSAGEPVACGHQQIVVLDRVSRRVSALPEVIQRRLAPIVEPAGATFAERLRRGGSRLAQLFPRELRELSARIARGEFIHESSPYFDIPTRSAPNEAASPDRVAWICGGQGALDPEWAWRVACALPNSAELLDQADALCRAAWGSDYRSWLSRGGGGGGEGQPRSEQIFKEQLTLYLGAVFTGRILEENGFVPDLILGHSVGEIAAAVLGGALDASAGLTVVATRASVLLRHCSGGSMLVLQERESSLAPLLSSFSGLTVAVRNHDRQLVVAGPQGTIEQLRGAARAAGIACKALPGFAFHSSYLLPAVAEFYAQTEPLAFASPRVPVFSPMEQRLIDSRIDRPSHWASHLIRTLEFGAAMRTSVGPQNYRFVECGRRLGLGKVLEALGATSVCSAQDLLGEFPAGSVEPSMVDVPSQLAPLAAPEIGTNAEPIAIVAVGCRLPGAKDFDEYRRLLETGECAIADLRELSPELERDFYTNTPGPDKTYTLLSGVVDEPDAEVNVERSKLARLVRAALAECRVGAVAGRSCVVLGATADGCAEYDEALVLERLYAAEAAGCPSLRAALSREIERIGTSRTLQPASNLARVARELLGETTRTIFVDAACASSLYAIATAARLLAEGECDVAYAGGAFAPSLSNNCLFAQFEGLAQTGSYPLDQRAEGVVFGEGAAFVALRRLSDALASGERVLAVLRGVGLSSDGRSPSASTPRADGQRLAIERAYVASGISPRSVQYVEAHATGTAVGDATELEALSRFFRAEGVPVGSVRLGSVKSQISHTGWAAGVASLIKVVAALAERNYPAQHHCNEPSTKLEGSPFRLESGVGVNHGGVPWNANIEGQPRRAAVNGFGFGGANAHLIVEEFSREFHQQLIAAARVAPTKQVLRAGVPLEANLRTPDLNSTWPAGALRLLPDVVETLDATQWTAAVLASQALEPLLGTAGGDRNRIGVVVGMRGKTSTILRANDRIFRDRVLRISTADSGPLERAAITESVMRWAGSAPSSTPYTLTGGMPNLVSGRVCQLFDLKGPNCVFDAATDTLESAMLQARAWIAEGTCDWVLAFGIDAVESDHSQARVQLLGEAARVVALALPASELSAPRAANFEQRTDLAAPPADIQLLRPVLVDLDWRSPGPTSDSEAVVSFSPASLGSEARVRFDRARYRSDETIIDAQLPTNEPTRVLLVLDLAGDPLSLVQPGAVRERDVLAPLWAFAREHYASLEQNRMAWGVVCLNAWVDSNTPRPETGLVGGFMKSLARELPQARLIAVHTDAALDAGLSCASEGLLGATDEREVFVLDGRKRVHALSPVEFETGGPPQLRADSVVLATGGARGITAELVAAILQRFGCRVALLGRSDPELVPPHLRGASAQTLEAAQSEFVRGAVASGSSPRQAKAAFAELAAAHEVLQNLSRFQKLPGEVSYLRCDLTEPEDVARSINAVAQRWGTVSFVLHGAGVQTSSKLNRKTPEAFWAVLDVKIAGLRNLLSALQTQFPDHCPQLHVATSAFSYFGNDGQQDYGAANEALNRLADCASALGQRWSTLGWLAWDGVGMTRGSEYRALARAREMRALSAEEGQSLFRPFITGATRSTSHVLLSANERSRFRPRMAVVAHSTSEARANAGAPSAPGPKKPVASGYVAWSLSVARHPYLTEHTLRGCPVLPACVTLDRIVSDVERGTGRTARALRECQFLRAIRVPLGRSVELVTRWTPADGESTSLDVMIFGDVLTSRGEPLESQRCYAKCQLILEPTELPKRSPNWKDWPAGVPLEDPYLEHSSPIHLGPSFDCLEALTASEQGNRARYRPPLISLSDLPAIRLPTLLLDALLRVGVIGVDVVGEPRARRAKCVFVPTYIEQIWLAEELGPSQAKQTCDLVGTNAKASSQGVECAWVAAHDDDGSPLITLTGYRGHRVESESAGVEPTGIVDHCKSVA
ncbi:MAG TPA: SDR family NAD(P)-dependent oxidoreductase [Polyangiaceae bacterium]|nr:SDR family NAD(P)-dependent oxidoreductase [Polyangiaceae bacterium]